MWTFAFQCCFGAAWNCDKSYWHISILYMCHLLWCGQNTLASVCWFTSSLGLTEMFIVREESNCADRCIRTIIQKMEILRFTLLYARKLPTCKQSYLQYWTSDMMIDRWQMMTTTYENVDKLRQSNYKMTESCLVKTLGWLWRKKVTRLGMKVCKITLPWFTQSTRQLSEESSSVW